MEPGERKSRILKAIVESYITSGDPIGSKALAQMFDNCVSSATIRNDMTVLTSAGYLEQPHTSAGRLPTAKALAFYVEHLMEKRSLSWQDVQIIDEMLGNASGDATRLLEDACRALADLTGLAAIATSPDEVGCHISRIDVIQMSPRNMAVVLALDNGFLRTRMCRCQRDIPGKITVALADYMCRRFLNKTLDAITVPAMQEIILELGELGLAVAPILSAFYELVQECAGSKTVCAGQFNLLRHPAYSPECAKELVGLLNERDRLFALIGEQAGDGVQIVFGNDTIPELGGSCMIVARYALGDRGQGAIGIIGPMGLDFADVIPRVEYFACSVGQVLTELFKESSALDMC